MEGFIILVVIVIVVGKFIMDCAEESRIMRDVDRMIQKNAKDSDRYFKEKYGEDFGKRNH